MLGNLKCIVRKLRIFILHKLSYSRLNSQSFNRILFVAPHPDDEVIGCGGLIARLVKEGRSSHVVIMTGGEQSHNGCCATSAADIISARRSLTLDAARILGLPVENIHCFNFPDGGISLSDSETCGLQQLLELLSPDAIFIPHRGEGWSDHVETGRIIENLIKGNPAVRLYEYCVWFWYYNTWNIDWKQARIIKLSKDEHLLKLKAMYAYIRPLATCGKPWSGVLPKVFVRAISWNKELYFEVK